MTAGRKPNKAEVIDLIDPSLDQPKIAGAMVQMRTDATELALVQAQHDSAVRAVALQMGYQLPADCTDPDLIQRDISANMRRSVEACLEVGKGLRVLKEACGHGNFMMRLEVLGIDVAVGRKFIQAAGKFSNRFSKSDLTKAIGSQTKLFEMLILDDTQIEELELTGQTGELKLDDVALMSVKDLREAVRKERLVAKRMKAVNDELNTELALKSNLKIAATDWPDRFKGLMDQAQFAHKNIKIQIGSLTAISQEALKDEAKGPDEEASLDRAREVLAEELVKVHSSCAEYLEQMGVLFDKTLGAFASKGLYQ